MIVVTGGAGFIGSNIVKALNEQGIEDIIVVDNLGSTQKHRNLNGMHIADFIHKSDLHKHLDRLKGADAIFHEGACSSTTESDGVYMMENNYEYSKMLLHFAIDNEIPFLYASSASVYGDGDNGFTEDRNCEYPLNVYAYSKFQFDNYVRSIFKKGMPKSQVLGLRYFNVYGFQENHKGSMASVPFHFFNQVNTEGKMKLFEGSDKFFRDFIFVEDVVKVNMFFYKTAKSGIFNCGTGVERSFTDIAKKFQELSPGAVMETIPFPEHLKGKYQEFTKADTTALRAAGYEEKFYTLEEGVEKYYNKLKASFGMHL